MTPLGDLLGQTQSLESSDDRVHARRKITHVVAVGDGGRVRERNEVQRGGVRAKRTNSLGSESPFLFLLLG